MSPSSIQFKHPLEDALIIGGRGSLSGFEFDGTGGSLSEQLKKGGKKQGTSDDDDDDGRSPQGSPVFDDFMVGPPELINPNPTHELSEFEVVLFVLELLEGQERL
ncbi:hypothetical protein [Roseimaritima ulvae]|uniref:Uncharacterized protein n=1 Tax=Roseimaritima ulvae TaxID=980254 RepID=A0A5B9QZY6_9BACT|nr:hypothetical protein [Roseimaritima ulvae]QEG39571.1 hypothetical protein UC8_15670 [Roseimaritima ulvae]